MEMVNKLIFTVSEESQNGSEDICVTTKLFSLLQLPQTTISPSSMIIGSFSIY